MKAVTKVKPRQAAAMQIIIELLAKQRGIMIYKMGEHFNVENPPFNRLTVENIGNNQIAVGHTFVQNGDLMYDPEIVYQVYEDIWFPMETTMHPVGYWRNYLNLRPDGSYTMQTELQHDAAHFSDEWAANIKAQGFLEAGQRIPIIVPEFSYDPRSIVYIHVDLLAKCMRLLDRMWLDPDRQGYIDRLSALRKLPGNMNMQTALGVYDYWMMRGA